MDHVEALRSLVEKSTLTIPQIAVKAGVTEQPLRRWFYRRTEKLNFVSAGLIYFALTGQPLIPSAKPPRKRRAA